MGFLSLLGDIGAGIAAPFTGGASLGLIPAINGVSSVLGAQQKGKAQGAATQAQLQDEHDRNAIALYQAQQAAQNQAAQTDLQRQQFGTTNRGTTAKQALIGALLGGGYKPSSLSVPGIPQASMSGGLARSILSDPNSQTAMKTLFSQANTAQNTPVSFTGGQIMTPPTMTPLPNVGGSGFLSNLADIGQLAGAATAPSFLDIMKKLQQNTRGNGDYGGETG